jgi:hypothetical protein
LCQLRNIQTFGIPFTRINQTAEAEEILEADILAVRLLPWSHNIDQKQGMQCGTVFLLAVHVTSGNQDISLITFPILCSQIQQLKITVIPCITSRRSGPNITPTFLHAKKDMT